MISRLPVRPRHCDAQAMMHATRYYEYFEDAFLDWLGARGGYERLRREGADLVVKVSGCEHHAPARLGDVLAVRSAPARIGSTSITMTFTMRRGEELVAVGTVTYVCVRDGRPSPLPAMLAQSTRLAPGSDRTR
ncbi:acyl-CoA thioesterase [Nonomuraea sp. MG754425]|uniref:acyl-CoA thioesterase n=1 Tax=Nonomuraea sp. MG754425 TaxID=2570319 RepID=UPI001F41F6E9|nr:thioesterase family protein [Nonomuraea sp. MG754425]MCF6475260.1 acyl-CoA thioesterase [Nonomuraea sp. MG754425]